MPPAPTPGLEAILNLSRFHREHEKFYARAPLAGAMALQSVSRTLKTLADRWSSVERAAAPVRSPYAGCEDLNEHAAIQHDGVLFMEGEGEPAEIARAKRDLEAVADDYTSTGEWLASAMEASWSAARALVPNPDLAAVLGERHRIIANDWQAAGLSVLVARLVRRALEVLDAVELTPAVIRADLAGARIFPDYLYSASELLDRAADLVVESATLVHDNERRWRVFRERAARLAEASQASS
jgi:hypothetical protein